jgi:hypothetical protein
MWFWPVNRMSLCPGLLWLTLNLALIIQCLSRNNVFCFNFTWPPLWSSGQSSWLQIQRSVFDFRRYQIFWEVVGLERGPPSLVSTIEELLRRKSSGCGLENREYGCRYSSHWPCGTLYLTSPTSGGRSVGIVRSRTQATEFSFYSQFYIPLKMSSRTSGWIAYCLRWREEPIWVICAYTIGYTEIDLRGVHLTDRGLIHLSQGEVKMAGFCNM